MDFTTNFYSVNMLVIFGATVASMLFGGLWFSPVLAGIKWKKLLDEDRRNAEITSSPMTFIVSFVMQFFAAGLLAGLLGPTASGWEGIRMGYVIGFGFIMPTLVTINLFEQRSWQLVIIYTLYGILALCLMGFILGQWS